ncbi:MAG: sugar isomerase domain-containing protein [Clostridiaceae bacterium]|nr:sugar isomerase domain-containing protein [Clostridiaceae bacterium]
MLIDTYFETVDGLFERLKSTQKDACIAAGHVMADAIAKGNAVHIFDTGHIVDAELIYRGGGLLALKTFKYNLHVDNNVRKRDRSGVDMSMEGLAKYALRASGALPGDVMIIGSVSGKTVNVIDLALAAKEFGLTVIALTSVAYSSSVESKHSSGKRLFECADIVLDNCAPVAEGMIPVEGIEAPFAAASGLAAAFLLWSCCAVAIEDLLARGITPSVLKSANFQDGPAYNKKLAEYYEKTGF